MYHLSHQSYANKLYVGVICIFKLKLSLDNQLIVPVRGELAEAYCLTGILPDK